VLKPRARLKEWGTRAVLLVASVLVCAALLFAAGEMYLRIRYGLGGYRPKYPDYAFHEDRGWTPTPGDYDVLGTAPFRRVPISINSLGLRDREISLAVPPGGRRITVLGDSFVFGEMLRVDEGLTGRLQQLTGDAVEIVNVSAPGYGTGQEYLLLRELMDRGYEVGEKVILAFFANDILDNLGLRYEDGRRMPRRPAFDVDENGELTWEPPTEPAPEGRAQAVSSPLARRVARWFNSRLVVRFLNERLVSLAGRYPWVLRLAERSGADLLPDRTPAMIVAWYSEGWQDRWRATERVLEYVTRRGRLGTAQVVVLYVPSSLQVEESIGVLLERFALGDARYADFLEDPDRPQRLLREFCLRNDVPCIDPTRKLIEAAGERPVYYLREGHLNAFGSEVLAREVYGWLVADGDVPGPRGPSGASTRLRGSVGGAEAHWRLH
jgi:hypothetical protein